MRSDKGDTLAEPLVEKLKNRWLYFWEGVLVSLAEEEMRIRHEEFDKQIATQGLGEKPYREMRG
jgi:hypothetical protein